MMGERLGLGVVDAGQHLQPRGRRRRRAARSPPASCCWPRRARSSRARALPINRADVRLVSARFGAESGMLGAALHGRSTWRRGDRSAMSGRLVVCPTPIGNLEDVTLRVLSALREADVIACEDTRTTKVLLDRYGVSAERVRYDAHDERRVAPRLVERMRVGRGGGAGQRRRDAAGQRPGLRARAGVHGGGARGRGAARARARRWRRWWRRAWRPRRGASSASCRARRARWRRSSRRPRRWWRSSRRAGSAASLAVLAARRPGAPGGRLPRADQGPRGGRARVGRRAGGALRGARRRAARSCS